MTVEGVDLGVLLAPLPANDGAGEDAREDFSATSVYQRLRDARAGARAEERAQDAAADSDAKLPDAWREVRRHAITCLSSRAKDFEVAAWLTEALVRMDGLAGLTEGARLITGLAESYWDSGFPRQDEDGWDARAAPLGGLAGENADGTLMQSLRRLPLIRRADTSTVGLHLYAQAEDIAAMADAARKKARLAAGAPDLAAIETEGRADAAFLRHAAVQAREAAAAWAAMDAALTTRFGDASPSTRRVAEALARMQEIGIKLTGPLPAEAPPPAPEEEAPMAAADAGQGAAPVAGPAAGPRPLRTRDDAIRQLEDLAEWFRKTEPHSPMAYTLEDAVRRARMPLPELLAEVLPDAGQRKAMLSMLGIKAED